MSLLDVVVVLVLMALAWVGVRLWRRVGAPPSRQAGHETLPAGDTVLNVAVSAVSVRHSRLDYAPEERVEGELVGNTLLRFRRRPGVEGEVDIDWELVEL